VPDDALAGLSAGAPIAVQVDAVGGTPIAGHVRALVPSQNAVLRSATLKSSRSTARVRAKAGRCAGVQRSPITRARRRDPVGPGQCQASSAASAKCNLKRFDFGRRIRDRSFESIDRRAQEGSVDDDDMNRDLAQQIGEAALRGKRSHEGTVLKLG
jgi:hypothetical protein